MAAHGKAVRQLGDSHAERLEHLGQIKGGSLPRHIGVQGQDHLFHLPPLHALDELGDGEVLGLHAVERGYDAHQYMVAALHASCALDREHVGGFFHHADDAGFARAADRAIVPAGFTLHEHRTRAAQAHFLMKGLTRSGDSAGGLGVLAQQMKDESLRALRPHPRKAAKRLDALFYGGKPAQLHGVFSLAF